MKKLAFTLVELLVVIALIAILAAILFPVFARAKDAAKKTTCLSNIRQISQAWTMYAADADERACPSYYFAPDYSVEYAWDFVIDWASGSPPKAELGLLGPFTQSRQINACPSFNGDAYGRPFTGYSYNTTYIGADSPNTPALLSQIAEPQATALFADAGFGNPVAGSNYLRAPSDPYFIAGKVHFRHLENACVAYADTHAKVAQHRFHQIRAEPGLGALSEDDSAYDLE